MNVTTFDNDGMPNFFIVGFPKCGTTALADYLSSCPGVFIPKIKEPEYFAMDFMNRPIESYRDYKSLFRPAFSERGRFSAIGEASVCYAMSDKALVGIKKFNNEAKIIVMIRNPIDLVVSLHAQLIYTGAESEKSFQRAWEMVPEREKGRFIPRSCRDPKWLLYSSWGAQGSRLEKILGIFDRNSIHVVVFDDFIRNTKKEYDKVISFIGAEKDGRSEFPVVNSRKYIRFQYVQQLLGWGAIHSRKLRRLLGLEGGFGVGAKLSRVNTIDRVTNVDSGFQEELKKYFRDDVYLLSDLVDRDLRYWVA